MPLKNAIGLGRALRAGVRPALLIGALFVGPATGFGEDAEVIAIYAAASPRYVRTVRPDGSFKPETYAFGEGEYWGGTLSDATIDKLKFMDVARRIAPALAGRGYLPSKDPQRTDLLIMVYWGMTSAANNAFTAPGYQIANQMVGDVTILTSQIPMKPVGNDEMAMAESLGYAAAGELNQALMLINIANKERDQRNWRNAVLLGYSQEWERVQAYTGYQLDFITRRVVDELEDNRYFVILLAYDFQALWKQKQKHRLWEARFSLRERGHDFSKVLASMADQASRYFGQDSNGLVRRREPVSSVTFGEPRVLESEPGTKR